MMMDETHIELLIKKFWDGTASKDECVTLLNFLDSNEFDNKFLDSITLQSNHLKAKLAPERKKEILEKIEAEINKNIKSDSPTSSFILFRRIAVYAAAIVILFTTFTVFKNLINEKPNVTKKAVARVKIDTISNGSKDIQVITLPDKSRILLYPNSSICFEHTFKKRNIELMGKAVFQVFHDEKSIFSVTTGEVLTTDIGTEFEIDALTKEKISIHLLSGKVKVGKSIGSKLNIQDQYLNKGELLKVNTISGKTVLEKPAAHLPPKTDYSKQLVFNKTPLNIVFSEIASKYDTKIKFEKEQISGLTFTGKIEPKDPLLNILNIICNVNNLSFFTDSSGIVIVTD